MGAIRRIAPARLVLRSASRPDLVSRDERRLRRDNRPDAPGALTMRTNLTTFANDPDKT